MNVNYAYFPGCSMEASGRSYEESMLAVFGRLGVGLTEIEDWNCCGATAFPSVDAVKSLALSARNLALAERHQPGDAPVDVLAPCAGCYRALLKTERELADGDGTADRVELRPRAGAHPEGRARGLGQPGRRRLLLTAHARGHVSESRRRRRAQPLPRAHGEHPRTRQLGDRRWRGRDREGHRAGRRRRTPRGAARVPRAPPCAGAPGPSSSAVASPGCTRR